MAGIPRRTDGFWGTTRNNSQWKVQLPAKCAEFYELATTHDGSFPSQEAAADHYLRRMVRWQGPERMQAFIEQDPGGYVRRHVTPQFSALRNLPGGFI